MGSPRILPIRPTLCNPKIENLKTWKHLETNRLETSWRYLIAASVQGEPHGTSILIDDR